MIVSNMVIYTVKDEEGDTIQSISHSNLIRESLFIYTDLFLEAHLFLSVFLSFFLWKRIWKIVHNKQFPKCLLLISNSLLFSSFNTTIFISVPCHLDIIQNSSLIHSIRQSNLRVLLITGLRKSNIIHSRLLQVLFSVAFHKDPICMAFLIHKC